MSRSSQAAPLGVSLDERSRLLKKHEDVDKNAVRVPIASTLDAETQRLHRMHHWEKIIVSGPCWPMDEVREVLKPREGETLRILSVSSGSGIWPSEMAREFPHAEVLGIDTHPQRPSDTPPNCRFEVMDLLYADITHLQGKFDVVHCNRGGGRPCFPHRPFWAKLAKLVRPGGLLLYFAGGVNVYDENKNLAKPAEDGQEPGTGSWWARFVAEWNKYAPFSSDIPFMELTEATLDWLQSDPHLEGFKEKSFYLPIGWAGIEEDDIPEREEVGRTIGVNAIERARSLRPALLANGMPPELLERCIKESEIDIFEQRVKIYLLWHFCAARARIERED